MLGVRCTLRINAKRPRLVCSLMVMLVVASCTAMRGPAISGDKDDSAVALKDWPLTCDEAISRLVHGMDPQSKLLVRETPKQDLIKFHHGWGTSIRNSFGLWQGNKALFDSCMAMVPEQQSHPDTVSMVIIEGVWEALQLEGKGGT